MDNTAGKNDKENDYFSDFDDDSTCDKNDYFSDEEIFQDNVKSNNTKENKTKKRREKGPPIVCLMCKTVWTKTKRGGRLFMFGGTRPFMAKFEAKLKALMGQEDLSALQNKSATKFGRSYICRECYLLVRQTYDNIRRLQRDVSKSVQRMKSTKGCVSTSKDHADSGSDQDLEINYYAQNVQKKKLPPLAERIADKIANLTLVKINNKVPVVLLKLINDKVDHKLHVVSEPVTAEPRNTQKITDSKTSQDVSPNYGTNEHSKTRIDSKLSGSRNGVPDVNKAEIHLLKENNLLSERNKSVINDHLANRNHNESAYSSKEAAECSAITLNMDTSFASQHVVQNNSSFDTSNSAESSMQSSNFSQMEMMLENNPGSHVASSLEKHSRNKPSPDELAEILANPLLLIKSSQPIKLAEVKNDKVYICGEDGCDWIFSSKFFWENHIRHYHRSGRPFICPFEGCERSFTGKSKLELHVRSHTDERPFICDKCGSGFRGNQELRAHRLTHTSEKPHQCLKCDKNFKLLSSLKRHLQFHDGGEFPFPCTYPECEKAFKSRYDLKCHNRLHTGEKPYKCPEPGCGMSFRIPCQFTMHKRTHTGEKPFRCTEEGCSAAYISSNALQAHMLSHTSERPFCCEFCGKTFKHKMLYRMHLKKHSGCQSFLCPVENCGEEYADRRSVDQHMISNHGIQSDKQQNRREFVCPETGCGLKYSTDGGLRYHNLKVHKKETASLKEESDSRILACPFDKCQREYADSHSLQDHLARAHIPLPRERMCQICGQAFPYVEQLEKHVQNLHDASSIKNEQMKGVFVCNSERCGVHFRSLEDRQHHVTWHLGNPPYRCEFEDCERTFLLESVFTRHVTEHETNKPFTCSLDHCHEGFTSHIKLLKHSKVHYGFFRCPIDGCSKALQTLSSAKLHLQCHEKPYVCMACGKRFATSPQLVKHKRSHTGEKVYECKVCSCQFENCETFKDHKRIHKGEKQYMCEECGQRFSSQISYKHHMKIHSRDLPLTCPEERCTKTFSDIVSLKAHRHAHSKPSNLCTQCGKVYKFSVSKHRCKVESNEFILSEAVNVDYVPQQQPLQQLEAASSSSLPPSGPVPLSRVQPVPQSITQSISQSIPLSIPQSISQTIPQSISQSVPQSIPQSYLQTIPKLAASSMTHSLSQPVSQQLIQTVSRPVIQSLPPTSSQISTQSLPRSLPNSLTTSVSQTLTTSMTQILSQTLTQSLPQTLSYNLTASLPQTVSQTQPLSQTSTSSLPHVLSRTLAPSMSHILSQSLPPSLSQTLTQTLTPSLPQNLSQNLTPSLSQTLTPSLVQNLSQTLTQTLPQALSQTLALSLPQALPQSLNQDISTPMAQSLTQAPSQPLSQHPSSQPYMNSVISELQPQSYVMEVEDAARAMRNNFGATDSIVVDPPYYNYIILYDRSAQQ